MKRRGNLVPLEGTIGAGPALPESVGQPASMILTVDGEARQVLEQARTRLVVVAAVFGLALLVVALRLVDLAVDDLRGDRLLARKIQHARADDHELKRAHDREQQDGRRQRHLDQGERGARSRIFFRQGQHDTASTRARKMRCRKIPVNRFLAPAASHSRESPVPLSAHSCPPRDRRKFFSALPRNRLRRFAPAGTRSAKVRALNSS